MSAFQKTVFLVAGICLSTGCAVGPKPYGCGPVMGAEAIRKTFQPIIDYVDLKPGESFADVGASSGYYTVMMSTLTKNVTYYIEDIDTSCLNTREFNKVIAYYSKQSGFELLKRNEYKLVLGD